MSHAEKCPVCDGRGTIPNNTNTTDASPKTCHGCDGRGWVTVNDGGQAPVPTDVPVPYYIPEPVITYRLRDDTGTTYDESRITSGGRPTDK